MNLINILKAWNELSCCSYRNVWIHVDLNSEFQFGASPQRCTINVDIPGLISKSNTAHVKSGTRKQLVVIFSKHLLSHNYFSYLCPESKSCISYWTSKSENHSKLDWCLTASSGDWFKTGGNAGGYSPADRSTTSGHTPAGGHAGGHTPAWLPGVIHQLHQLVVILVVIHQQCRPLLVRIWKSHEVEERQLGGAIRLTIETCQKFLIFFETFKIWSKSQGLLVSTKITSLDALWHRLLMLHLIKSQEVSI